MIPGGCWRQVGSQDIGWLKACLEEGNTQCPAERSPWTKWETLKGKNTVTGIQWNHWNMLIAARLPKILKVLQEMILLYVTSTFGITLVGNLGALLHGCIWLYWYIWLLSQRDNSKRCDKLVKGHNCAVFTKSYIWYQSTVWLGLGMEWHELKWTEMDTYMNGWMTGWTKRKATNDWTDDFPHTTKHPHSGTAEFKDCRVTQETCSCGIDSSC